MMTISKSAAILRTSFTVILSPARRPLCCRESAPQPDTARSDTKTNGLHGWPDSGQPAPPSKPSNDGGLRKRVFMKNSPKVKSREVNSRGTPTVVEFHVDYTRRARRKAIIKGLPSSPPDFRLLTFDFPTSRSGLDNRPFQA